MLLYDVCCECKDDHISLCMFVYVFICMYVFVVFTCVRVVYLFLWVYQTHVGEAKGVVLCVCSIKLMEVITKHV